MDDTVTCYEILEVQESATAAEIKTAYRRLAQTYHPDKVEKALPDLPWVKQEAEERFRQINEAWEVLGNPQRKVMYDEQLKAIRLEEQRRNYSEPDDQSGSYRPSASSSGPAAPPNEPPPPPPQKPPPQGPLPTAPPSGAPINAVSDTGKTFSRGWANVVGGVAGIAFFQLARGVMAAPLGPVFIAWLLAGSILFGVMVTGILTKKSGRAIVAATLGTCLMFAFSIARHTASEQKTTGGTISDPLQVGTVSTCTNVDGPGLYQPKNTIKMGEPICIYAVAVND